VSRASSLAVFSTVWVVSLMALPVLLVIFDCTARSRTGQILSHTMSLKRALPANRGGPLGEDEVKNPSDNFLTSIHKYVY
jgi:hypothetical protein